MTEFDSRPLVERITDELRARVIDGRLAPGSRLRQEDISNELGVSRTPLREAFRRLQGEGWFQAHPRQGIVVRSLSLEVVVDIAVARMLLEPMSAALAAVVHEDEATTRVKALASAEVDLDDPRGFFKLNREFHFEISGVGKGSKDTDLNQVIRRQWEQFSRYRLYYWRAAEHIARSVHAHKEIVAAWVARDASAVELLVARHNWFGIRDQIEVMHPGAALPADLEAIRGKYGLD